MQKGQQVVHKARPELGVGEVVSVESVAAGRLNVRFASTVLSCISASALALAPAEVPALKAQPKSAPVLTPKAHLHNVSQRYGIRSLWHMTSRENVASILGKGLMSRHQMQQAGLSMVDISNATVQHHRAAKGTRNGLSLHDHVPLYLRARNPMLFCRRHCNPTLCLLEIDRHACLQEGVLFADADTPRPPRFGRGFQGHPQNLPASTRLH